VDFLRFAEGAAALLNADLSEVEDLRAQLNDRAQLRDRATDRDCMLLRKFQRGLRPVFRASQAVDTRDVVDGLNELMVQYPLTPHISDHDGQALHLHVTAPDGSVADQLIGESLLGLATLVCDLGPGRLGVCSATPCTRAFVDVSPNRSRRYCSDRCSSRANVAAFRARRKASIGG
jgi:predicted RNA-binding Zn ribbon-like protein